MTPTGNWAAALTSTALQKDTLDLFGVCAGASYDLRTAAGTFDRAALRGDTREVPHALATARAAANRVLAALSEYERSLIPFPQTMEASNGR